MNAENEVNAESGDSQHPIDSSSGNSSSESSEDENHVPSATQLRDAWRTLFLSMNYNETYTLNGICGSITETDGSMPHGFNEDGVRRILEGESIRYDSPIMRFIHNGVPVYTCTVRDKANWLQVHPTYLPEYPGVTHDDHEEDDQFPNEEEHIQDPAAGFDPETPNEEEHIQDPAAGFDPETPNEEEHIQDPAAGFDPETPNEEEHIQDPAAGFDPETPNEEEHIQDPAAGFDPETPNEEGQDPVANFDAENPQVPPGMSTTKAKVLSSRILDIKSHSIITNGSLLQNSDADKAKYAHDMWAMALYNVPITQIVLESFVKLAERNEKWAKVVLETICFLELREEFADPPLAEVIIVGNITVPPEIDRNRALGFFVLFNYMEQGVPYQARIYGLLSKSTHTKAFKRMFVDTLSILEVYNVAYRNTIKNIILQLMSDSEWTCINNILPE